MSALRRSDNENMLSMMNLIHTCYKDSILQAGNPVKEILLKLNLPDHSDEVLKLKNLKKDALLKLFKLSNQERYEHVGPEVISSQDGKDFKMAKRDYAWLMILRCSRSHSCQINDTSQSLNSMITASIHKLMIEFKDYELKTNVEALYARIMFL
ncbi:hypothetical protein Tco_0565059 [Tanacetum coccineum]